MSHGKPTDPLWYKDAIIYQLHIKSFYDSNGDGCGDIEGLRQKLDYIQDLGADTIWVLPFYPSPLRDDGYDIADYESINPLYGTEAEFRRLLDEAHSRGLRIITELVINHTSDQHPWFQAARHAEPGSAERDFYIFSDSDEKYKEARIIFTDTEKSNWTWDDTAKAFFWHRFFSHQPDLNYDNPRVLEAMVAAMNKWLAMGVDGLRLDAIPYLVERDGTNCENLPQTHEVIKKLRAAMDARFENRLFLAEANQWPCDVRQYFGDEDECHMAYNFPIMPRLYLALHMENSQPIVDIIKQTPPIPDNCQWAVFLRNHDELTLEMVTDSERDYMYRAYAKDPLMRINVGIRRRLSPLLEYNRKKLELMNGLLLSLNGTPIIYYGDEIGMGDNLNLGDRHGMRTPMQWSAMHNGGFSQAASERLIMPMITDSKAGYHIVNVAQQQNDPDSLLSFMKKIIYLRRRHKVFGRGSLEVIDSTNRAILAFIRKYHDETVLVVANLSGQEQSGELALSDCAGAQIIEMISGDKHQPVSRAAYRLTLQPYQFLWLNLGKAGAIPSSQPVTILNLDAADPWQALTAGALKEQLEGTVLPAYIERQRWYGGKAQTIKAVRLADCSQSWLPDEPAGLLLVEVEAADSSKNLYALYVAIAGGARALELTRHHRQHVLAEIKTSRDSLVVYDGLHNDAFCRLLLKSITGNAKLPMAKGACQGLALGNAKTLPSPAEETVRRISAEQSNSSLVYGERLILKLYRKLLPGINLDCEISRFLSEQANFTGTAAVWGTATYHLHSGANPFTLGLLQSFSVNQGDAWELSLAMCKRFYESLGTSFKPPSDFMPPHKPLKDLLSSAIPATVNQLLGAFLQEVALLGERTGQLHCALASGGAEGGFTAEIMDAEELSQLAASIRRRCADLFALLPTQVARLSIYQQTLIGQLLSLRQQVELAAEGLKDAPALKKIRCHGDYHLGQVLNTGSDFIIYDFEGEPGRSIDERRKKQPALKDVAGMMRSFSYAAYAALFSFTNDNEEQTKLLLPWAQAVDNWAAVAFLKGYRPLVSAKALVPADDQSLCRALIPFVIEKAVYEIAYELNNRPGWLSIPVAGLVEYIQTIRPGSAADVR